MRIVLTGAGGFLGREIARELRARGHRVAGMRRRLDGLSPDDFIGDFLVPESYRASFRNFAPDILIHCGWHGVAKARLISWKSRKRAPMPAQSLSSDWARRPNMAHMIVLCAKMRSDSP